MKILEMIMAAIAAFFSYLTQATSPKAKELSILKEMYKLEKQIEEISEEQRTLAVGCERWMGLNHQRMQTGEQICALRKQLEAAKK